MRKDNTAFRERFQAWKEGKKPYQDGLPAYAGGTEPNIDHTIDFLKQYEGFKDTTYTDGNGIPTIGYGFTDSALVKKGKISRAEADARLKQEVLNREAFLSKMSNWDKLNNESKTALRSYYYNYPAGFKDTTKFMKAWNSGNYREAIRQVDAGWNDTKNPGLRKRRQQEQAMLMADPFLMQRPPAQSMSTIVEQPISTNVRQVIPEEQTRARWTGAESVSPYVTGKPMVKLQPTVKMPNLIEMVEDSLWLPGFKNGKLPEYANGDIPGLGKPKKLSPKDVKVTGGEPGLETVGPIEKGLLGWLGGRAITGGLSMYNAARAFKQAKETYRQLRAWNEQTRDASRAWKIADADRTARNPFYSGSSNPLGWLYDTLARPAINAYDKLNLTPIGIILP